MKLSLRILFAWIVLAVVQAASGMIVQETSAAADNALPWFLLSNLLLAMVLGLLARRSDWHGIRLALALSAIPVLINLTNDIDGIFFLTSSGIEWKKEIVRLFVAGALQVPLWMLIFRRGQGQEAKYRPFESKSMPERVWRFAASDLAYCILYSLAGMTIWFATPALREFYATQTIPPVGKVLALQFFLRGPIYVVICLILARMIGLRSRAGAILLGIGFAILNGVVPLLVPNRVFPDSVRLAHLYEVVSSNLVFGFVVGCIWRDRRDEVNRITKESATILMTR